MSPESSNGENLVSAFIAKDITLANIVRNALQAEGIEATVDEDGQSSLPGIFDVHVFVHKDDLAQAQEVLAAFEAGETEDVDGDADA